MRYPLVYVVNLEDQDFEQWDAEEVSIRTSLYWVASDGYVHGYQLELGGYRLSELGQFADSAVEAVAAIIREEQL
jgi:hypothetical protein